MDLGDGNPNGGMNIININRNGTLISEAPQDSESSDSDEVHAL